MSTYRVTILACDWCADEYDSFGTDARAVRRSARRDGWSKRGGADICPECVRRAT